jgi:uncharacterized membrane protein YjjB (DUF3815 family)
MAFLSNPIALVDLVLALVAIEALGLYVLLRWTGRGPPYAALLANLGAGVTLVCAVRAALTGASYGIIAGMFALSLVAHLSDLWLRWRK